MPVQIPDDTDFLSFREQCESQDGWVARYNKGVVTVWCRDEECKTVQKLKASEVRCNADTSLFTLCFQSTVASASKMLPTPVYFTILGYTMSDFELSVYEQIEYEIRFYLLSFFFFFFLLIKTLNAVW